jgi:hypothetical protein
VFFLLAAPGSAQTGGMKIVVQEGEGAINNIQQHRAKEPVVQVLDANGAPVAGASVSFLLPDNGAGGEFADGARMLAVITDEKGQAVGRGLRPNQAAGRFQIRVTASYHGQTANAVIAQINAEPAAAKSSNGKLILILALVGGAAAAGAAAALGHKGSGSSTTTTTTPPPTSTVLVPGSPSIQAPH